jgi:uncharacterized protein
MRKFVIRSVIAVLFLAIPFFCFAAEPAPRTITTTGESIVKVVPDNAVISLTVETVNQDLKAARSENNAKINSILNLCKKEKIENDDIKTSQISVSPRYQYELQKYIYKGMQVRQSLSIVLKDISKYNSFLDELLGLGTRYVNGVDFKTTELKKYREQARSLALNAAKEKAEKLAAELSQKLGKPLIINEGFISDINPYYRMERSSQSQVVADDSESSGYSGTGLIDVSAVITVTFELID